MIDNDMPNIIVVILCALCFVGGLSIGLNVDRAALETERLQQVCAETAKQCDLVVSVDRMAAACRGAK